MSKEHYAASLLNSLTLGQYRHITGKGEWIQFKAMLFQPLHEP
jgi:hypothetical protein